MPTTMTTKEVVELETWSLRREWIPRLFGILLVSFVMAAIPIVAGSPVSPAYYQQSPPNHPSGSYESTGYAEQPAYDGPQHAEPAYDQQYQSQPAYQESYPQPEQAYDPSYQDQSSYPTPTYLEPHPQQSYDAYPQHGQYDSYQAQPSYASHSQPGPYDSYQAQPSYDSYPQPAPYDSYQAQPSYDSYPKPGPYDSYQAQPSYDSYHQSAPYDSYRSQPSYDPYSQQKPYDSYSGQPSYDAYSQPKAYGPYQDHQSYDSYPQPKPYEQSYAKKEYYPEYVNYEAITFRDFNASLHCGIVPAVNMDLYRNRNGGYQYGQGYGNGAQGHASTTQALPFGKNPWMILITDDYNNVLCQGTIVQDRYVLTLSSCVDSYGSHKLRVRYGEWDILNNSHELEVYKNVEARICRKFPVTCYSSYGYGSSSPSYGYSSNHLESVTGLTLLQTEFEPYKDAYPHVRPVCLPEHYEEYYPKPAPYSHQPSKRSYAPYNAPSYAQPNGYKAPAPYSQPPKAYNAPAPSYSPAPYVAPPTYYNKPSYVYYSDCYVSGYYGSPTTRLQNHRRPVAYEGYGNSYAGQSNNYYSKPYGSSYEEYRNSKTPKVTKVKQINCDSYNGYRRAGGYGKYGQSCAEDMCFVGVEGGDACVADYGSAVICLVKDKAGYDAGYSTSDSYSYGSSSHGYSSPPPQYSSYQSKPYSAPSQGYSSNYGYGPNYYKKEIRAAPAQDKVERYRAVVVAVVRTIAQCSNPQKLSGSQSGYGYQRYEGQSNPIVAIKVTDQVVDFTLDKVFEGIVDGSCPAPTKYYNQPSYSKY